MSFIIILIAIIAIAVLGLTFGVLRKNKAIAIICLVVCILIIIFALFLMFVLIPAM